MAQQIDWFYEACGGRTGLCLIKDIADDFQLLVDLEYKCGRTEDPDYKALEPLRTKLKENIDRRMFAFMRLAMPLLAKFDFNLKAALDKINEGNKLGSFSDLTSDAQKSLEGAVLENLRQRPDGGEESPPLNSSS